jgi:osmotically inducible protein OsmC
LKRKDIPMIKQQAQAVWRGGLKDGNGSFRSGTIDGNYSFASRFEGGEGSTPEELIGAAQAACFSMALSLFLGERGHTPESIRTTATVSLDPKQLAITQIELETEADVAGLDEAEFRETAEQAKQNCPVSKALGGVRLVLRSATLTSVGAARR